MSSDVEPQEMLQTIDDAVLIKWLKEHQQSIDFISFKQSPPLPTLSDQLLKELKERKDQTSKEINNLNDTLSLNGQAKGLLNLWKLFLGNAIVYLKLLDDREKYHDAEDFGVEKLYRFFETFHDFEGILYGADDYYRDHVSHMLRVFLLGEYVIHNKIGFEKIIVGDDKLPANCKIHPSEKEAMWCIIALTHDLGYALETVPDINKKVRTMLEQFGNINLQELVPTYQIQPLHKFIIQFISSNFREIQSEEKPNTYVNHVQSKYYLKFSGAFERQSHGIMSCIVNMRNLVFFLESDYSSDAHKPLKPEEAKQFLIRSTILRSIASHDCDEIYYLTIPQFPFLLTIFDEMQEWDRPRLKDAFQKAPKSTLKIDNFVSGEFDSSGAISVPGVIKYEIEISYDGSSPLTPEESEKMQRDTEGYFERKRKKIKKILRSAVGGDDRNLKLIFKVIDATSSQIESEKRTYTITHSTPEDVKMEIERKTEKTG